ncbi:SPOC like C-terminal domain-containing protein [Phycomyces nitens]|nr:SPOC like C-terminal domain-containing protein [Phycomyces nitens]
MIGLIATGTAETKNSLASQFQDQYQNICTVEEINQPTLKTLQRLSKLELSESTETTADSLDALILAVDMIVCHCGGHKYEKQVYLMTDTRNPVNWMENNEITAILKTHRISLVVVSPGFNLSQPLKNENTARWKTLISGLESPSCTLSLDEAYQTANLIYKKVTRPSPSFRGGMILGDPANDLENGLYLNVFMFLRTEYVTRRGATKCYVPSYPVSVEDKENIHNVKATSEFRPTTLEDLERKHRSVNELDAEEDEMERNDDGDREDEWKWENPLKSIQSAEKDQTVDTRSVIRTYRLGKKLVPVLPDQQNLFDVSTAPGLYVIKFIDSERFPETYKISKIYVVTGGTVDTTETNTVLTALAKAMYETNSVAMVRYTSKSNTPPKLGVLFPCVEDGMDFLYFVEAPFCNDIKNIPDTIQNAFKVQNNQNSNSVSDTVKLESMEKLVESMSLLDAGKDEDGNPCEHLVPEKVFNPLIWRVGETVRNRALDENAPIPDLHQSIKDQINVLPEFVENTRELAKQIQEIFQIEKVEDPNEDKDRYYGAQREHELSIKRVCEDDKAGGEMENTGDIKQDYPPFKKVKMEDQDGFEVKQTVLPKDVFTISVENPIADFRAMVGNPDRDLISEAFEQISDVVIHLIATSFGDKNYKKIIDCLDCMRNVALQDFEGKSFNKCLQKVKLICNPSNPDSKHIEFWDIIKNKNITLITTEETISSDVTDLEARKFMENGTTDTTETKAEKPYFSTDDLLDSF